MLTATDATQDMEVLPVATDAEVAKLEQALKDVAKEVQDKKIGEGLKKQREKSEGMVVMLELEKRQEKRDKGFMDKMKGIFSGIGTTLKKTFDFLVVKPAAFVLDKIKKHPYLTAAIILAAIGIGVGAWYYMGTISVGPDVITHPLTQVVGPGAAPTIPMGRPDSGLMELAKEALKNPNVGAELKETILEVVH